MDNACIPGITERSLAELTVLIGKARNGDAKAAEQLFASVYQDLRRMAARQVRQGQGGGFGDTSLVHEAWFRLGRPEALGLKDRQHFYAVAARVMRQIAIDHARRHLASKRGSGAAVLDLDAVADVADDPAQHELILSVHAALEELETIDARLARLVELRFYAGMNAEETATAMDLSLTTLKRDWRKARAFLLTRLGDVALVDDDTG